MIALIRRWGELVTFSHTIFMMPFAAAAVVLALVFLTMFTAAVKQLRAAVDVEQGLLAATHLGVIAGPKHLSTTTDRLSGLRHAARDHCHILPTRNITYAEFDRTGKTVIDEYLAGHPEVAGLVLGPAAERPPGPRVTHF